MRFIFIAACLFNPRLLPTPPRGDAVGAVFGREQFNSTGRTFTCVVTSFTGAHGSNVTVGLGALGKDASFSGATNAFYLADVNVGDSNGGNIGQIRIVEVGTTNQFIVNATQSNVKINTSDTYRLTLEGTYEGNSIALRFTIENVTTPNPATGVGSFTISGVDTTPINGTFFGLRNRTNASGGAGLDVNFDNYTVVPEPSAITLVGFSVLGLAARRRRQR